MSLARTVQLYQYTDTIFYTPFEDVEFLGYRTALEATVECGAWHPAPSQRCP
jgi:hypothetical protein